MRKPPELMKKCSLLLLLFFVPISLLLAQDFSNRGKDFWLAYPAHIDNTNSRMALYISSTENTSGQIDLDGKTIPFTVTANQATTIQIPPTFYLVYNSQADGINAAKGIHITSLKPVVVYAHILNAARSGSTLVFPTNVLGKEYVSLNFTQTTNQGRSQITVVATEDNTTVEFNLKANSSGAPVRIAGQAYTISLNKGDVYQVQSLSDLTGSSIRSISTTGSTCKPIAVFTGSTWTGFCSPTITSTNGGDNLFQQIFPSNAWGRNYITAPFARKLSDIYRIIVKDPTTVVSLNGTVINAATIKQNSYYDFVSSQPNIITADKPILVVQYMTSQSCDAGNIGDPEMVTINPLEQTINNVSVVSARRDLTPPNTNITSHYLNVLMKTANTGSLKIDGAVPAASWVPIPNSAYSYLREDVTVSTQTNPSHNIQADSGFIAIAYGMGNVESYGYNAGTNIVDLNPPVTIQNPFPN
nr:IgGFc-binding protein [Sediminibacterium sp.]